MFHLGPHARFTVGILVTMCQQVGFRPGIILQSTSLTESDITILFVNINDIFVIFVSFSFWNFFFDLDIVIQVVDIGPDAGFILKIFIKFIVVTSTFHFFDIFSFITNCDIVFLYVLDHLLLLLRSTFE